MRVFSLEVGVTPGHGQTEEGTGQGHRPPEVGPGDEAVLPGGDPGHRRLPGARPAAITAQVTAALRGLPHMRQDVLSEARNVVRVVEAEGDGREAHHRVLHAQPGEGGQTVGHLLGGALRVLADRPPHR